MTTEIWRPMTVVLTKNTLRSTAMTAEVWRTIPGFSAYEVSDLGRVRSVDRMSSDGKRRLKGKLRKATPDPTHGYPRVGLRRDDGELVIVYVHRLVLLAFVGEPKPYIGKDGEVYLEECRHFPDGDRQNNRLDNLSWGTRSQNLGLDKRRHRTDNGGARNGRAKLTIEQVGQIRALRGLVTQRALAAQFGVCQQVIQRIQTYKIWLRRRTPPEAYVS